jgi:hypothetical protein
MKTQVVPLSLLADQCLFIKAEIEHHCFLLQKSGRGAYFYKSHKFLPLNDDQKVILVAITYFVNLPVPCQFVSLADALAPSGIILPDDLQVKTKSGYAERFGNNEPMRSYGVTGIMEVVNMAHIFNIRMVPEVTLNID